MSQNALKSQTSGPMTLIAGPCVIEDEGLVLEVATELKLQLGDLMGLSGGEKKINLTFKASFDKANRTAIDGFRGPGMEEGLKILDRVRSKTGLPILTDFHTPEQAIPVAEVVDFMQIPAFLCRQTDLIVAGAEAALKNKRRLNVKKGQFLAPWDAKNIVEKVRAVEEKIGIKGAPDWLCLTERGSSFGYNALVVDMGSFVTMKSFGVQTIHDATHCVQSPGGGSGGKSTGGKREMIEPLARAAIAAGADGLFMECHPRPESAKSDGPNAFYLEHVGTFIRQILQFRDLSQSTPWLMRK
jgi:2-dehydro-3-deoxyphosphooctonate aldolase (KDO 8-P synthase)